MATRAVASAVFDLPIETVWAALRDFTFPSKLIDPVESCVMEEDASPNAVGAVRRIKWKSGEERRQRLIELSDQYRSITWETVETLNHVAEASAQITNVKLHRVTETNATLVEWASDFSSDVSPKLITFEQASYLETLKEIRSSLTQ